MDIVDRKRNFTIDKNGAWEKFTTELPRHSQAIGTVTWEDGASAALIRFNATGGYAAIKEKNILPLSRIAVEKQFMPVGRPKYLNNGRKIQVYLDEESLASATRIGGGNISAGVRAAIKCATACGN